MDEHELEIVMQIGNVVHAFPIPDLAAGQRIIDDWLGSMKNLPDKAWMIGAFESIGVGVRFDQIAMMRVHKRIKNKSMVQVQSELVDLLKKQANRGDEWKGTDDDME